MLEFTEYTKIFISLFAILDPIGMIPVIILFTASLTRKKRIQAGRMTSLTVGAILLVALLAGEPLLAFFGISINSFRVAGGILLMLMSITMLHGNVYKPVPSEDGGSADLEETASHAIVPLSTPLLAGPGSISAVIVEAHKVHGVEHYLAMSLVIFLLTVTVWLTFLVAPWVAQRMGKVGIDIFTRLMGLILAAIAVEFIATGARGLFPALG